MLQRRSGSIWRAPDRHKVCRLAESRESIVRFSVGIAAGNITMAEWPPSNVFPAGDGADYDAFRGPHPRDEIKTKDEFPEERKVSLNFLWAYDADALTASAYQRASATASIAA
jgi:hypothetical protein